MKIRLTVCDAESLGENFSTFRSFVLPWSSWSSGVRRTFLWNHSPHTTRRHIRKVLTLHHHRCDNHRPRNVEHSPSVALETEVRSTNLSNADQRWKPVDCDYVRTGDDCCRLCMTPCSLEDTVRLSCCDCQGRRCLILVLPLRESQIF